MKHVLVLAALAACTSFDSIDRNVCGNGLLETGEDCDSSDASCVRCSVACESAEDCPTSDYACGVDGLCHAPGGALGTPSSAGTFQADELRITDIDRDGIGDALGLSRTSVIVRYGDAAAKLGALESSVTPTQTGPAAFGQLDADNSVDLTLTTRDGLVSYASPYGSIVPIAVQSLALDKDDNSALDIRMMVHVAPAVMSAFVVDPATSDVYLFAADIDAPGSLNVPQQFAQPCVGRIGAIDASDFDPDKVDVYQVQRDDSGVFDAVIVILTNSRKLCVLSVHRDAVPITVVPWPTIAITDITPTGAGTPAKRPVLADLDTNLDRCPGLVNHDGGPRSLIYFDGEMSSGKCAFSAPTPLPMMLEAPASASLIARVPVDPPVAFVASDAIVTDEGVYVYLPSGIPIFQPSLRFSAAYKPLGTISSVAFGRFNADDEIDGVIAIEGQDDLDVLLRAPGEAGFQLVRIDTASAVTGITVGDFDGNRLHDVAFTELFYDHERMMVAYGTPDRLLDPVSVGSFASVDRVARVHFPDSVDYLNLADDLIVFQPPPPGVGAPRLTLLHGSPQRTMLSYFDPRPDALKGETLFRGSVIGHFAPMDYPDLIAIAPEAKADVTAGAVRAWRMPGTPDGVDTTTTNGVGVSGLEDCSLRGNNTVLCLEDATYIPFSTATKHDVVIGVDRTGRAIMLDPWSGTDPVAAVTLDKLQEVIPDGAVVRSLHGADLDGDGTLELVASFAPGASSSKGAVIVCSVTSGIPDACEDLVPAIVEAAAASEMPISVAQCYDATPARLSYRDPSTTPNAAHDLVVACRAGTTELFRVQRSGGSNVIDHLATIGTRVTTLRAGDVTGDGVDDLVMIEGESASSLLVYPQCTSRDVGCVTATSTSAGTGGN